MSWHLSQNNFSRQARYPTKVGCPALCKQSLTVSCDAKGPCTSPLSGSF